MERFCEKCGSFVNGDVKFCPTCGAPMKSAVDLGKSEDIMPQAQPVQPNYTTPNMGYGAPQYGQSINPSAAPTQNMTTGQWIGTILLCSCFGLISFILTAVWAFGSTTPEPKRGFCKGYFIVQLILIGISIIIGIITFTFIMANINEFTDFFEKLKEFLDSL